MHVTVNRAIWHSLIKNSQNTLMLPPKADRQDGARLHPFTAIMNLSVLTLINPWSTITLLTVALTRARVENEDVLIRKMSSPTLCYVLALTYQMLILSSMDKALAFLSFFFLISGGHFQL